jgi:hypothetical protein
MKDKASDLVELLAPYETCEDQIETLEAYVLNRFEVTKNVRDVKAKRDLYWSIALEIQTQAAKLISKESWALLIAANADCAKLFDAAPWKWHDRALAQIGPRLPRNLASLNPDARMCHETRLAHVAKAAVNHVLRDLAKQEFPGVRKPYHPDIDAAYPLRDIDGNALFVSPDDEANCDDERVSNVAPFLDQGISQATRANLYQVNLYVEKIVEGKLLSQQERPLIGQLGAFARRAIPEKTCIGIYGGMLLDDFDRIMLADQRYLAKCPASSTCYVNGENILSLLNTTFRYDASGAIIGQGEQGINVHARYFPCKTGQGASISPIALFASRDIEKGSELRWSYGYDNDALAALGLS